MVILNKILKMKQTLIYKSRNFMVILNPFCFGADLESTKVEILW